MNKMLKASKTVSQAVALTALSVTVAHADIAADIAAAGTAGATNAGLAGTAVLTIVTAIVGFGIVISMLRKS